MGATLDPQALSAKLDKLLAMRGDPKSGVGAAAFAEALAEVEPDLLLTAVIASVRELLVPEWASRRKADLRPQRALETAEIWMKDKSNAEAITAAKAAAKACTEARNETFGDDHRVPEAARHAAWAATAKDNKGLFEALEAVEHELLARIALTSEYHLGPEQRRAVIAVLRRVFIPAAPKTGMDAASLPPPPPAPYSTDTHFELGQVIIHKKFGNITVTSVGETWVEVEIPDGTKKRLAHKP
jgi:hypothetical protein